MPFLRHLPIIVMMSVSVLLNRDTSDTINVSPFFIFAIVRPNFLPEACFFPLTTSDTQRSTRSPFKSA